MKTHRYVAFLRGINVGGNTVIKMEALRNSFESLGFTDVRTVLASGNVLFEAKETDSNALQERIANSLQKTFGFTILVLIRSSEDIRSLVAAKPFNHVTVNANIKMHVSFLGNEQKTSVKIPDDSSENGFRILRIFPRELGSVVEISDGHGTPELMSFIDKHFGRNVTTRTWDTVLKIDKLFSTSS